MDLRSTTEFHKEVDGMDDHPISATMRISLNKAFRDDIESKLKCLVHVGAVEQFSSKFISSVGQR